MALPELNKSTDINGLRGKLVASYKRSTPDQVLRKLGKPQFPGKGKETGTQSPTDRGLDDQANDLLHERELSRASSRLVEKQKIGEHSIKTGKFAAS